MLMGQGLVVPGVGKPVVLMGEGAGSAHGLGAGSARGFGSR